MHNNIYVCSQDLVATPLFPYIPTAVNDYTFYTLPTISFAVTAYSLIADISLNAVVVFWIFPNRFYGIVLIRFIRYRLFVSPFSYFFLSLFSYLFLDTIRYKWCLSLYTFVVFLI